MRSPATVLALAFALGGCSTLPTADRVTTPGATHSYVLAGRGSPTVVLEAGLGDGRGSWAPVFGPITDLTQTIAYDRAGYGASESATRLRDGASIVRELRSMLHALGLRPPFVLVGHSIGGTYMELFARTWPAEVAGVVLVDSRPADFTRRCQATGARSCKPPALLAALLPPAPRRELAAAEETMSEVLQAGAFPDVPLAVLTSAKKVLAGARYRALWLETQESLAALSADSTHRVCGACGHYIHRDEPELVVAAIDDIVRQARSRR